MTPPKKTQTPSRYTAHLGVRLTPETMAELRREADADHRREPSVWVRNLIEDRLALLAAAEKQSKKGEK